MRSTAAVEMADMVQARQGWAGLVRAALALVLALTPALLLGAPSVATAVPVPVAFTDPALEAAVRLAIAKPTGVVTSADMLALTDLEAPDAGIADLTGLQYAANLDTLNLAGDQVTTITALAGLTHLTSLNLDYDTISTLAPLANLTSLESVSIAGDGTYSDLTPLAGKPALTWLTLSSRNITDLTPLAGLTGLDSLDLTAPGVTSLAPLAGLAGLDTLRVTADSLAIAPLSSLGGLTTLSLTGGGVDDLAPLAGLTNLTDLNLEIGGVSDLAPISGLTGLVSLRVASDSLVSIAPLSSLANLESLVLNYNQITDITPLSSLANLRSLEIGGNSVADLRPLSGLTNLESLVVSDNLVTDLTPLVGMPSLTDVTADHNWLDLTPGHAVDNAIASLEASGVAVFAAPQNASVSRPSVSPSTRRRGKPLTFTSAFAPAGAAPAVVVKLKLYRYETKSVVKVVAGRRTTVRVKYWHLRRNVTMKGRSTGRLTAVTTCAYTGSWRAYVVFAGSDSYEASTSDVRSFTVK